MSDELILIKCELIEFMFGLTSKKDRQLVENQENRVVQVE